MAYIEDIFIDFYDLYSYTKIKVYPQDHAVLYAFYVLLKSDKSVTEKQASLILKLLKKYQRSCETVNFDYSNELANPQWKKPFRVMDLSKVLSVNQNQDKSYSICLKFPYSFKSIFDEEFSGLQMHSSWDPGQYVRKFPVNTPGIIYIYEFALKHKFEIDDSFLSVLATYEEILNSQESIKTGCKFVNGQLELINPTESAIEYWESIAGTEDSYKLLMAKSMGYPFVDTPETSMEKIAASKSTKFWIKTMDDFLSIYQQIQGRVCVILDRASDSIEWIKEFDQAVKRSTIDTSEIKVCFRTASTEFNDWVKDSGYGGKVDAGRILIFNHKPAKWLFKDAESVKIIVSNSLYPSTNLMTKEYMNSHPCVMFLGDIKPSELRKEEIVEL